MKIIDVDGHLYERRTMWREYADPRDRHLAIEIVDDDLGYAMLTYKDQPPPRGAYCWALRPVGPEKRVIDPEIGLPVGFMEEWDARMAGPQRAQRDGLPATDSYDDIPADYYDPDARLASLDRWGIDECVLFPNFGLEFETLFFDNDVEGLRVNQAAWNRWAAEVAATGKGRLHPVGHLTLQGDQEWPISQLKHLGAADIKFGFLTPGLVNGERLSSPTLDPIWEAFIENDVSLTFHINFGFPRFLAKPWVDNDHITFGLLNFVFGSQGPQLGLADLILNGVFDRHPDLRVAVIEQGAANWLADLAQRIDSNYKMHPYFAGWDLCTLKEKPSDYLKRNCRFGTLGGDNVLSAIKSMGDVFAFGGDYPHPEGLPDPLVDYRRLVGVPEGQEAEELLYGRNAAWLLNSR